MKHRAVRFLVLLALAWGVIRGQGTTSRVLGTVVDPSNAPVVNAGVKLTNEGTNLVFPAKTAENGAYFFEAVPSGLYTLTVEAAGFKKFSARGNQVSIGQPATVNVTLEIGSLAETVEVSAAAEVVQTSTSGNYGNLFSDRVIADLPIVGTRGRNPLDLVTRQPGVVSGANTGGGVHVNGARDRAWNYTVDGIDANESSAGGSNFAPIRMNPDGLAEFRVLTGNFTAEYGRNSGGQVAMVTKSGSNEVHGNAFWFYRTPRLNADEWENNLNRSTNPRLAKRQFVQNIPGGQIGGPILRNKLFYYGNFQLLRARESAIVDRTVYTESMRQGIYRYNKGGRNLPFQSPGAVVDASGNVAGGVNIGTYNVFANDPSRLGLDPTIKSGVLDQSPLPNNFSLGDGLNTAGYTFSALQIEKQYDVTLKGDYVLNDKNTLMARVSFGRQDTTCDRGNGGQPVFPGTPCWVDTKRDPRNLAFNWRSNPRPSITNELVFGQNYFAFDFNTPTADIDRVTMVGPVAVPSLFDIGNKRAITTWQFVDNLAWFRGAHNLKFGTNLRLTRHNDTRGSIGGFNSTQNVNFLRTINTVDPAAFALPTDVNTAFDRPLLETHINFLLGRVGATNRGFVADGGKFTTGVYGYEAHMPEYDFYVQDTWKLMRTLTVDLGLRWEAKMSPRSNPEEKLFHPNQVVAAGAPATNTLRWERGNLYRDDWKNLLPSIGIAWDPTGRGRSSFRLNYRMASDRLNSFVLSSSIFQNLPGIVDGYEDQAFGQGGGRLRNLPVLAPPTRTPADLQQPAAFSTRNITVVDPNFEYPQTHQWGLSFQQQVWRNTVVDVSYIGRRAHNLFGAYNANQANQLSNGFADGFRQVQGGAQSNLMNQLLQGDTRRRATETGSDMMRRLYPSELRNNNAGSVATDLSRRTGAGGKALAEIAGLGPYFFLPFPQFAGGINVIDSNDFSTYHALQAQIQQRYRSGLEWQFSYTLSKSMDTRSFDPAFTVASGANNQSAGSTPFDIYNRRGNYALSDFDRKHVVQSYWVYELPFGKGKPFGGSAGGMTNRLIGGWQVGGLVTIQGGRPFSVYSGFNTFNNVVQSFADCTGCDRQQGSVFDGPGGVKWYFDQADIGKFSTPAVGSRGFSGRNGFRGPGSFNMDASLLKRTAITEKVTMELRGEAVNLTNTPTFGFPTATLSSSTFGRIRDTVLSSSRKIQLGAKISF